MLYETVNAMEDKKPIHVLLSYILSVVILFPHIFSVTSSASVVLNEAFHNMSHSTEVASVDRSSFEKGNSIVKVNATTGTDETGEYSEYTIDTYEDEYAEDTEGSFNTDSSAQMDDSYGTEGSYNFVIPGTTITNGSPVFGWQTDDSRYTTGVFGEDYTVYESTTTLEGQSFMQKYIGSDDLTSVKVVSGVPMAIDYAFATSNMLHTSANVATSYTAATYVNMMSLYMWLGTTNFYKKKTGSDDKLDKSPDKKPENPMELLKKAILNDSLAENDDDTVEEEPVYRTRKQEL